MKNGSKPMTLEQIRMRAAANAANNRSMIPMDRLRPEKGTLLAQDSNEPSRTTAEKVEAAIANSEASAPAFVSLTADAEDVTVETATPLVAEEPSVIVREGAPVAEFSSEPFTPNVKVRQRLSLVTEEAPRDDVETPTNTTPFVDELCHAVIQLGMWEKKISQKIVIGYPDGRQVRLGDLLMKVGEHLMELDKKAPRILLPGMTGGFDA